MNRKESQMIAEEVVQIRKRERTLKRWRNFALLLIVIMFVGYMSKPRVVTNPAHIAMINIDEQIMPSSRFWRQFKKINSDTKAVLILMNSPGGTVGDSERLYYEIEHLRQQMPVTVLVENQATSGAYLASLASDRIYSYHSALIGSIGVVFRNWITRDLMDKIGIQQEQITTGEHKGYPSSYEAMPAMVRAKLKRMLEKDNQWFLHKVLERRKLDKSTLPDIKEAQVYNAADAVKLGLIDGFSTRFEQVAMLQQEVGELPIKNLTPTKESVLDMLLDSDKESLMPVIQAFLSHWVGSQPNPWEHSAL